MSDEPSPKTWLNFFGMKIIITCQIGNNIPKGGELKMGNIKISVEYVDSSEFKGQVCSRIDHSGISFYAATRLNGGTFSTFDQADAFMDKLGYHKLEDKILKMI